MGNKFYGNSIFDFDKLSQQIDLINKGAGDCLFAWGTPDAYPVQKAEMFKLDTSKIPEIEFEEIKDEPPF